MTETQSYSVQYGTTTIQYDLSFAARKTIAIDVHPDQRVQVTAPQGSDLESIAAVVRKRGAWIVTQQRQFATYAPPEKPRAYVSGEAYRYLGRQYRLKVVAGDMPDVTLGRSVLAVTVPDRADTDAVKGMLDRWLREQAYTVFRARLAACFPRVERLDIPRPLLLVKPMETRWGSCSYDGEITLNPRLMQAPYDCIDYVILHELCHLKEHNHSKRFYRLLDQVLPDWRERKKKLNALEVF
jgi:hypothetical protein